MSKYEIDYQNSKELWKFSMDNCILAEQYQTARQAHAGALKELKLALAKAYRDKKIDTKMSEEKAYMVLAETQEEYRDWLRIMIEQRAQYKGLEKVLEARQAAVSFNQSLIKNTPKQ